MLHLYSACVSFQKKIRIALYFILLLLSSRLGAQGGGCVCTNCPQFMPDNFTGNFYIQVQNATNATLGQNGQGVCGVHLNFDHEYIGDLQITLTSPSGQTVTLIGPIGLFGPSDFTTWDITFLPCGDPSVSPDPGFSAQWNNNQPWGLFGNYTGSYYPNNGCLQNFTGPVNGQWTLTVVDGQGSDVGNFYDYEIIFCDPSGIDCFSCAANAGNLTQADVSACEGSQVLNLNLPPTYTAPNVAPPVSEYSYTYVVSGTGGVILAYEPGPDLSSYPPGLYTVCGMSYLTTQEPLIPLPNGSLTTAQLTTQLASTQPPFCGRITANCVNVNIISAPPDIEETVDVCAPACYLFFGQNYCQSGTYVRNLLQNGCPYVGTLNLTVHQPSTKLITEIICPGGCSQNPSFPGACDPGNYQATLTNAAGCDSTVYLTLSVMSIHANIQQPVPVLGCSQATVLLQGTGSTLGSTYQWTASNGGNIVGGSANINATVNAAGDYTLKVCRTQGGVTCCDSATVTVTASQNTPAEPAINGVNNLCLGQTTTFTITPVSGASGYTWTVPPGVTINSGQNSVSLNVTWNSASGGDICVTANNACGPSTPNCLTVSTNPAPVPATPQGNTVVCAGSTEAYSIPTLPNATSYTWTVTGSAVITSGQGTNAIVVNWDNSSSGNVCVSAGSVCGASQPVCLAVTINATPAAPTVTGNSVVCAGGNGTYSVGTIPGAVSYNWQVTGGTITSGNGSSSVQVTWDANATIGTVCATAQNSCGSSIQNCFDVNINAAPPTPVITGTSALCEGTNGSYSITSINGANGYTWTVPAGATIISGQNTTSIVVGWSTAPGGNVCVAANSTCGLGPQDCFPVTVDAMPTANAGADNAVCGLVSDLTASASVPGSTGAWANVAGPGNASFINAGNDTTAVTVTMNGSYLFKWTETNGTCSNADTVIVNFNASPNAGQIIADCDGANQNYTVTFPITGGASPYTISGGATSNGVFLSDPIPSGQPYSYTISDSNGCVSQAVSGNFNCNCSTAAGQMSLQTVSVCEGGTVTAQHLGGESLDANDVFSYVLHSSPGQSLGTVLGQNSTGIFGFQNGMVYGTTYYISYVVGNDLNGLPDPADPCLSVSQGQPVVFYQNPIADAGLDDAVCGLVLPLSGSAGTGTWSVSNTPSGGNLSIGNPQSAATDATATMAGTYTLTWAIDNNGCTDSDDVLLTFNASPAGGTVTTNCDAANENYTVTIPISGGLAPYVINGVAIAGNSFTSPFLPSGSNYTYSISDANGCLSTDISGTFACNCGTNAGTMPAQVLSACEGMTVTATANTDQTLDANDLTAYVLHSGAGATLGQVFAQNTTGVFGFQNGMSYGVTYYISIVAGTGLNGQPNPNDPCFSVSPGQPVVFLKNPTPDAGADKAICGQVIDLAAVSSAFQGTWTQVSGPGTSSFDLDTDAAATVTVTAFGAYTYRWEESNGACTAIDNVTINFNETPAVAALTELCNSTNTQYSVSFSTTGGAAPYTVSSLNGSFTGNTFTSSLITNNTTYTFIVTDANGCATPVFSGVEHCNCATDAGAMVVTPALFCADVAATASWDNNANLDGDDIVQFILHDQPGGSLGTVFATNSQPSFTLGAGLQTGVTYYISAIAGNNLAGSVDLNDPCLSITPGAPVQWKPLPNASLSGDATICNGGSSALSFSGTGVYPLTLTYSDASSTANSLIVNGSQAALLQISPTTTTTYNLLSVSDGTSPTCSSVITDAVTITVNQPVSAGVANDPLELCVGLDLPIQLVNLLNNADFGGQWTQTSVQPSLPGSFNANTGTFTTAGQVAGIYTFKYVLSALAPCPNDDETVTVELKALPVADAGSDKALNCNQAAVSLGGPGTSTGTGLLYNWNLGGSAVGDSIQLFTGNAGTYTLSVTNAAGCTASDEVTVILDNEIPIAEHISVLGVRCFGDVDGTISVDSVTTTHPPILYSLNGGPFASLSTFNPLAPGVYTVSLMDANGCEWTSDSLSVNQPPQLLVELGTTLEAALGDSVYLEALITAPLTALDTIYWNPLVDSLHAGTNFQHFFPLDSRQINVQVVDTNGCTVKDRVLVIVDHLRKIYIPNIFKPGSDFNDHLIIYGGRDVAEVESFQIYDRWGEKMFEAQNFQPEAPSGSWDGKFKGENVSPGVYIYYAVVRFIDDEKIVFKGDVTVFR